MKCSRFRQTVIVPRGNKSTHKLNSGSQYTGIFIEKWPKLSWTIRALLSWRHHVSDPPRHNSEAYRWGVFGGAPPSQPRRQSVYGRPPSRPAPCLLGHTRPPGQGQQLHQCSVCGCEWFKCLNVREFLIKLVPNGCLVIQLVMGKIPVLFKCTGKFLRRIPMVSSV